MPTAPTQDAGGCHGCPVCGSMNTQRASVVAEDRIRNAIAAHWAEPPGPRGPDGRWLRSATIAWAGALAFAIVSTTRQFVAYWEWAALLLAALLLGAWADRRAARGRGWIDPLQHAGDIARQARERDARISGGAPPASLVTDVARSADHDLVCLDCGHRFEPAPVTRVAVA